MKVHLTEAGARALGIVLPPEEIARQRAEKAKAGNASGESEADFIATVIDYARLHGWLAAHFRPGRTAKGWATAVQGDGRGFPDLLLLRLKPPGKIVAELKVGRNKPSAEQTRWLQTFAGNGIPVYLWTPDDWETIERVLGGRP